MTDRFDNDRTRHPDWIIETRAWCASCCVPLKSCGCPAAERILDAELHIIRGSE